MKHDDNMWKYYEKYTQRRVKGPVAHFTSDNGPQPTCEHKQLVIEESTEVLIRRYCDALCEFMIGKNRKYGDSALHPLHAMSKLPATEGIKVRCDDKIKRFQGAPEPYRNDSVDTSGYLGLYCIAMWKETGDDKWMDFMDMVD